MRRATGARGSVSLLVVILLPALLVAAGLVLDGGRQLQARREARAAADAAARAATQLTESELYGRGLDPGLASGRAGAELGQRNVIGSVSVDGQAVTVVVVASVDYLLLPGAGSVSEASTSHPSEGVRTGSVAP